jgi:hemoglobin
MRDIANKTDIEALVSAFYKKIGEDELLSPFFKQLDLHKHLPKMVQFWSFVLLDEPGYDTNVTEKHLNMNLSKNHFNQWVSLFSQTLDKLFKGPVADLAKTRAALIAWTIESKMKK